MVMGWRRGSLALASLAITYTLYMNSAMSVSIEALVRQFNWHFGVTLFRFLFIFDTFMNAKKPLLVYWFIFCVTREKKGQKRINPHRGRNIVGKLFMHGHIQIYMYMCICVATMGNRPKMIPTKAIDGDGCVWPASVHAT